MMFGVSKYIQIKHILYIMHTYVDMTQNVQPSLARIPRVWSTPCVMKYAYHFMWLTAPSTPAMGRPGPFNKFTTFKSWVCTFQFTRMTGCSWSYKWCRYLCICVYMQAKIVGQSSTGMVTTCNEGVWYIILLWDMTNVFPVRCRRPSSNNSSG